jgi:hypothetical protein
MAGLNSSVFTYSSPGSLVAPQPPEDPFIFVPQRTEFEVKPDESPVLTPPITVPGGALDPFNPYPPGLEPGGQQPKVAPKIPGIERVNDYIKAVSIAAGGVQDVIRAFKGEPRMEFFQALLDKGLDPETAKDVVEKEGEPESPLEQARKAMGAPPSIPGYENKDVIGDFYPYPGRIIGTPGMIGGSLPA